jgi:hypothetical protein
MLQFNLQKHAHQKRLAAFCDQRNSVGPNSLVEPDYHSKFETDAANCDRFQKGSFVNDASFIARTKICEGRSVGVLILDDVTFAIHSTVGAGSIFHLEDLQARRLTMEGTESNQSRRIYRHR